MYISYVQRPNPSNNRFYNKAVYPLTETEVKARVYSVSHFNPCQMDMSNTTTLFFDEYIQYHFLYICTHKHTLAYAK